MKKCDWNYTFGHFHCSLIDLLITAIVINRNTHNKLFGVANCAFSQKKKKEFAVLSPTLLPHAWGMTDTNNGIVALFLCIWWSHGGSMLNNHDCPMKNGEHFATVMLYFNQLRIDFILLSLKMHSIRIFYCPQNGKFPNKITELH